MRLLGRWLPLYLALTASSLGSLAAQGADKLPLWLEDDFSSNVNRWDETLLPGGLMLKSNHLSLNPDKDFKLVMRLNYENADPRQVGTLVWGRKDARSYYAFEVSKQGEFRISRKAAGRESALKTWTRHKGIHPLGNVLELRHEGDKWIFKINGEKVHDCPAEPFFGSELGYMGSRDIRLNKLNIYQDLGEIRVAEALKTYEAERQNLGPNVNSEATEKLPVISPDGQTLYFIYEKVEPGKLLDQEIYYSQLQADGTWSKAQDIGSPINNAQHNFLVAALPDNNTLAVINSYEQGTRDPNAIIALTTRGKEGWSQPKPLSVESLQKDGRWVAFNLAADGKTLIYAVKRADSYGGRDIYVSFLQEDGRFSAPKNLGPTINTAGNEHCPFLAADGVTLYFDTDGHPGYGGRDIFMSRRLDETWTNWSVPENLGPAFNTSASDEGLMIPASGEYAYFASSEKSFGGLDIFRIAMPPALKPLPTALISGVVLDGQGKGTETAIRVMEGDKEVALARTDPNSGNFKLALPGGKRYRIEVLDGPEAGRPKPKELDLSQLKQYEERRLDTLRFAASPKPVEVKPEPPVVVKVEPKPEPKPEPKKLEVEETKMEVGTTVRLDKIYFRTASFELLDSSFAQLDELVVLLKKYPEMRIAIQGHTDSQGPKAYNIELSRNRSRSVRDYLVSKGVARDRLGFEGFGPNRPVASNESEAGRQANRRVEFVITYLGSHQVKIQD